MSAEPESIPRICDTCHATDDVTPIVNRLSEAVPYYLCIDRQACAERAQRQQREARAAEAAEREAPEAAPEGKHAATGPLQAVTDAVVADIAGLAAKASTGTDAPDEAGEVSHD